MNTSILLNSENFVRNNWKGTKNMNKRPWISTANRLSCTNNNAKSSTFNNKNDKPSKNSTNVNMPSKLRSNKSRKRNLSTIQSLVIEVNFKPKKIMFIDSITIILRRSRINSKVFIRIGRWSKIRISRKLDSRWKGNNMRLFKWEWQERIKKNLEKLLMKGNLSRTFYKPKLNKTLAEKQRKSSWSIGTRARSKITKLIKASTRCF